MKYENYESFKKDVYSLNLDIITLSKLSGVPRTTINSWSSRGMPLKKNSMAFKAVVSALEKVRQEKDKISVLKR